MRALGKIALAILLGLVSIEVAARLSGQARLYASDPAFQAAAEGSYWHYRANRSFSVYGSTQLQTGPWGERRHSHAGSASGPVIAVFGDSFTFGQAVESDQTWPALVEVSLQTKFPGSRVLNFGVQGHSLRMIIEHAGARLPTIKPAAVVLAFIADDLDPSREQKHVDRFGYLARGAPAIPVSWNTETLRAIGRQSHALLLLKHALDRRTPRPAGVNRDSPAPPMKSPSDRFALSDALRGLLAELDGIPILLAELDLRTTLASSQLRSRLAQDFPRTPLIYLPAQFANTPEELWRVPGDGHPSAKAHTAYASVITPALTAVLASSLRLGAPAASRPLD